MKNIQQICPECNDERQLAFRNSGVIPKENEWVKIRFTQEDKQPEHMWVKLFMANNPFYMGTLDNEPLGLTNIKFGDTVNLEYSQIEQHVK